MYVAIGLYLSAVAKGYCMMGCHLALMVMLLFSFTQKYVYANLNTPTLMLILDCKGKAFLKPKWILVDIVLLWCIHYKFCCA